VLTILFSSPDQPPSTIRQSARTEPVNFVTSAVGELAGTSNTAGYGCPITATATASTSARPGTVWGGRFRRRGSAVAAPGKIERPAQDRVKTDQRDAERVLRLLMIDALHAVRVPSSEQEVLRDLVRAREALRGDLMRARQRRGQAGGQPPAGLRPAGHDAKRIVLHPWELD